MSSRSSSQVYTGRSLRGSFSSEELRLLDHEQDSGFLLVGRVLVLRHGPPRSRSKQTVRAS
jgi:hypothetical protein